MKYGLNSLTLKLFSNLKVVYVQYQSKLTAVHIKMAECDSVKVMTMFQENS